MPESEKLVTTELSRDLNLWHVTLMGVGMMIGAGVFIGMGNCLMRVGPGGTMMTFTLNALLAMFSAMSYAELSSAIPRAGGAYNFARIGFGKGWSFIAGWMEWGGSTVAGSLYAMVFSLYVLTFLSDLGWLPWDIAAGGQHHIHISVRVVAAITATAFAYVNYRGASETGKLGSYITIGQTLTLCIIALIGVITAVRDPSRFQNFTPFLPHGWLPVLGTMGFIYVAFEGYEVIAQAGDETIEPRRNLPKAMMLSVVIVGLTYLFVSFASVLAVKELGGGWEQWVGGDANTLFSRIVRQLLPAGGGVLVVMAVVFSATSALNATTYSATRAVYALGRDHMLPPRIASISKKTRTPHIALLVTWLIILSIVLFLPVEAVASMSSMMFLFLFLLVNLCAIRMRRRMGDELQYGYVMPLFPLFPILAIIGQVALVVQLRQVEPKAWNVGPIWIAVGICAYMLYGKTRALSTRDEIVTFDGEKHPDKTGYRILLPVANPDTVLQKILPTMNLAKAYEAEVELLHMVPIPDQVPLSDAELYMDEGREAIVEAMLYLQSRFPIHETIRYCRNAARGILSAAREHQADMIITGWRGRSMRRDFLFGSTLDPILERNPCDVVVLRNCTERAYENILVPFAGGPHSLLAMRVASALVDHDKGRIVLFNVALPGKPTVDIESFVDKYAQELHCPRTCVSAKYGVSREVVKTVVGESASADLVVVGATGERRLRQFAVGSIPEAVADALDCPMIMVKAKTAVKGLVNRWL
jgi:amino acid transporter/nucleotide-binding universal stress UspA family protein